MPVPSPFQKEEPTGYKSTPTEELELRRQLEPLILDESKAYDEYEGLSGTAYNIGRPDIADELRKIAEDEWRHHTILQRIVRGL